MSSRAPAGVAAVLRTSSTKPRRKKRQKVSTRLAESNVFTRNRAVIDGGGYGINVAGPQAIRSSTEVRCDNLAEGTKSLSNVTCRTS